MKKKLSALALALVLALSLCLTGCGGSDTLTLNVYDWGEYILSLIHIYSNRYGDYSSFSNELEELSEIAEEEAE